MIGLCSFLTMQKADAETVSAGTSAVQLMQRVAESILQSAPLKDGKTCIVCGCGGNGGDGYALALLMRERGMAVDVVSLGESKHPAAAHYRDLCRGFLIDYSEGFDFSVYANVFDCIFGVGLTRKPEGLFKSCIEGINASGSNVISIDIASGLVTDSGIAAGVAVRARYTLAVQMIKFGSVLADGLDCSGDIGVMDVGIDCTADAYMLETADIKPLFLPQKRNVHKGNNGKVTIIAGSESFSGAAVLSEAAATAFALGCGLVRLAVPQCILYPVMNKITEATLCAMPCEDGVMTFDKTASDKAINGADAVLFGNGVDISDGTYQMLEYLVHNVKCPLVLDADGLNLLSHNVGLLRERVGSTVITPHPKEMSRLLGVPVEEVLSEGVSYATEFAARYGVTVVLKGAATVITDGKRTFVSASGTSGMAKAGSGDVLAGGIASLIARTGEVFASAYGGCYTVGLAGEIAAGSKGEFSMVASDTASAISSAIKMIENCMTESEK